MCKMLLIQFVNNFFYFKFIFASVESTFFKHKVTTGSIFGKREDVKGIFDSLYELAFPIINPIVQCKSCYFNFQIYNPICILYSCIIIHCTNIA